MFRRDFLTKTGATATAVTTPAFINLGAFASPSTLTQYAVSGRDELHSHNDGNPSLIVRFDSAEDRSNLREWTESQRDGRVLREYPSLNMMAVTVPWDAAGRTSFFGLTRYSGGLEELGYVDFADANAELELPSPIDNLDESGAVSPTDSLSRIQRTALRVQTTLNGGTEPQTDGLAFDGDAPEASLADARELVNAPDTLIDSIDTSTVTIAVIDTGLNDTSTIPESQIHGDSTGFAKPDDPVVSEDGVEAVSDGDGHGSWVGHCMAGFVPDASVGVAKSLDDNGSGETQDIIAGIEHAIDIGADVACLSLGAQAWQQSIADALEKAYEEGVFCSCAVGNDRYASIFVNCPASAERGFGVQATNVPSTGDRDDTQIGYFGNVAPQPGTTDLSEGASQEGGEPLLAAPGMNVTVEPTGTLTGTSMAAPMVAGGAALLSAEGYTVEEIWDRITTYAYSLPNAGVTETKHGLLDVQAAIDGTEPDKTQEEVRNDQAVARDRGNRTLSDAMGGRIARTF